MTATFVDIDDDTQAAVRSLWLATPELQDGIGELFGGDVPEQLTARYALVECAKGKDNQRMTGGVYYDFRNVTLTVFGPKPVASAALAAVLTVFNRATTLTLPSGARFVRWWPLNDGALSMEKGRRRGEEMWRGVVKGEVWSVRRDA